MGWLQIIEEIGTIAGQITGGAIEGDIEIAESILKIVQKGISALEAQSGKPIDSALIKPFEPIS